MLTFAVYQKAENAAVLVKEVEVAETDYSELNDVLALARDKEYWVAPGNEESAFLLMQPKRRKSSLAQPVVEYMHELRAEQKMSDVRIGIEVYKKFEIEVKTNMVQRTLRQEANTEVPLKDGLREKVMAITPTKNKRGANKKVTPELEEEIHAYFEEGKTGAWIAKQVGLSSSTVNTIRRKKVGYRVGNQKGQQVPEKVIEAPNAVPETA